MRSEEHLIDSLIHKILRRDGSPEVRRDCLDLLTKLAGDGSRSAKSLVRRLKFDAESRRWKLLGADEIRNGHRPHGKE
jgi:hypothetical protein